MPDVLAPGLDVVFCGINPGRVSAAAGANFANPRNDFWRLLHAAGFTPRQLEPAEQFELPEHRCGMTNAAYRTTPGSGDLRRADFAGSAERLERIARELRPRAIAFVGKEAYRGVFDERPDLGAQKRTLDGVALFVLPSTSPANAAVPWDERLAWFRKLREWLEPVPRLSIRALLLDADDRMLLFRFEDAFGQVWWATPGGGAEPGETDESTLRRELVEEVGLHDAVLGPHIWSRVNDFAWGGTIYRQTERFYLVRIDRHDVAPTIDLIPEGIHGHRWWSVDELAASAETFAPRSLAVHLRGLLDTGAPAQPLELSGL
ncbi:MAG: double-stranded uracil-DNA glycosylase [Gaiellaceae bacterium]|nr:double-stranded uracil-DNA glycosylase [Gaiellaceae bacterium]